MMCSLPNSHSGHCRCFCSGVLVTQGSSSSSAPDSPSRNLKPQFHAYKCKLWASFVMSSFHTVLNSLPREGPELQVQGACVVCRGHGDPLSQMAVSTKALMSGNGGLSRSGLEGPGTLASDLHMCWDSCLHTFHPLHFYFACKCVTNTLVVDP
jgi:hypothetical protein